MVTCGRFSSGRDQAAIDLLEAVCRQMDQDVFRGAWPWSFAIAPPVRARRRLAFTPDLGNQKLILLLKNLAQNGMSL
jgi:hypothetical protein